MMIVDFKATGIFLIAEYINIDKCYPKVYIYFFYIITFILC